MKIRLSVVTLSGALIGAGSFVSQVNAQWSSDPAQNLAVASGPGGQELPKVAAGPGGATWVSWFDSSAGAYRVYVQRLDAAGNKTFPEPGLLVSAHPQSSWLVDYDLTADAQGNAVIVFTDTRAGDDRDVYAYLISPTGEMLWGADGVTLSADDSFESDPRVVQASNGEYVFLWARLDPPAPGLYMQRLNAAGEKLLGEWGMVVAGDGVEAPAFCEMVAAEDGSVIAVWVRDTRTFLSPRHLRAQRFSATGEPIWTPNPVELSTVSVPIAHRPQVISDGAGGAVVAWHDVRLNNMFNVWVQRIDASGTQLFPAGGAQASIDGGRNHLDGAVAFDPASGSTFVFWDMRNALQTQWSVYGQKFDASGVRQWGDYGVELEPLNTIHKGFIRAEVVGGDPVVVYFDQPQSPLPGNRVLATRVSGLTGAPVWPNAPVVVSSVLSGKGRLPVALDASGQLRIVWEDDRNGTTDVYAQTLSPDGGLGAPVCPADWSGDGVVNSADISAFLASWLASLTDGTLVADFNGDQTVNSADISAFLAAWLEGVTGGC